MKPVLLVVLSLSLVAPAFGKEIAGIQVPETVTVNDQALVLNGAGIRSRFFIKVYVGTLYLQSPENDAPRVIAQPGPKSVRLHITYGEISSDQLTEALNDGFVANSTAAEIGTLKARIEQFRAMFPAVRRNDLVRLDLLPDGTTEVSINTNKRGAISGADFQNALLKIWLGDRPVDKSLKRAMLGQP